MNERGPFNLDVIKPSSPASSSLVHDRMFPDSYTKNRDTLVEKVGPTVPLGVIMTDKNHPLHDIVDAMLVLATCQELADGYSGVGYGMGPGSIYGQYISEAAAFVLGFHYAESPWHETFMKTVRQSNFVIPKRYADLVEVVRAIRAAPKDPKKDPEYKDWLRLNRKFGQGPTKE